MKNYSITINNSFCEFSNNIPPQVYDIVKQVLTYKNDIGAEKAVIFKKMRYFKSQGLMDKHQNAIKELKKLEATEVVCWLDGFQFPTGHLNIVLDTLKAINQTPIINDIREIPEIDFNIRWVNKPWDPRYFQKEMIELGKIHHRGVFESAVGTGKTLIMIYLLKHFRVNSLIIVPSKGLREQIYRELVLCFGNQHVQKVDTVLVRSTSKLKNIRIATIQTLASLQKTNEIGRLVKDVKALYNDETHHCLVGNTIIKTDHGGKTLKEIVQTKFNGKVLSYNSNTKEFEFKKILNHFKYKAPSELIEIRYLDTHGKEKVLTCTTNHKIFTTNRGYVLAEDLNTEDDIIIDAKSRCEQCGKLCNSIKSMMDHRGSHKVPKELKRKQADSMINSPNRNNKRARELSSERMKLNNPSHNPKIVEKQKIGRKKWWDNLAESERVKIITRFQNAPKQGVRKGPTSLECRLINLKIENLKYVGDGKFWVTSNGIRMNPDFKIKKQRKVIEVGDIEYWHTQEDILNRISNFKNINFECLYFTNRDLVSLTDTELHKIIKEFINGKNTIN